MFFEEESVEATKKEEKPRETSNHYKNENYHPMILEEGSSTISISPTVEKPDVMQVDITEIPLSETKEMECDFQDEVIGEKWRLSELLQSVPFIPPGSIQLIKASQDKPALGSGAFGVVYKGKYKNGFVAFKELNVAHAKKGMSFLFHQDMAQGIKDLYEAFKGEVLGMYGLKHPYLVDFEGCYETHDKEGHPRCGMVMGFCNRGSLEGIVEKLHAQGKRLSNTRIWRLMCEMAHGLRYLHSEGRIHRDLKPANVLIHFLKAMLADLGVARIDVLLQPEKEAKIVSEGVRDIQWMSPEEFEQGPSAVTPASDIYSLGLILLYLFTGEKPYEKRIDWKAEDVFIQARQLIAKQAFREPIPSFCPEPLKKLIVACCEQDPSKRATIQEVIQQLNDAAALISPELIEARLEVELDIFLHTHREKLKNYRPLYATPTAIEGDIDKYLQRMEDQKNENVGEEEEDNEIKLEDATALRAHSSSGLQRPELLEKSLSRFLVTPTLDMPVGVLFGEGGLGKTLTVYRLADKALSQRRDLMPTKMNQPKNLFKVFYR